MDYLGRGIVGVAVAATIGEGTVLQRKLGTKMKLHSKTE
jgi:hypothetical protein